MAGPGGSAQDDSSQGRNESVRLGPALHQAVNEIREIKSQIQALHAKFGDDAKVKPALDAADGMEHKMSDVEQQLIQVNMKGSEGNLAFPNMLNEAFDTFSHSVDAGDREPTKPQMDVFAS